MRQSAGRDKMTIVADALDPLMSETVISSRYIMCKRT